MEPDQSGGDPLAEAPPVVAVIVTRDPGPELDDVLAALADQTYRALSVLVVDAGSRTDLTARIAAALPTAFVKRLPADPGWAAAADEVLTLVQGASHLVFVHDDAALAPGAVQAMLEVAYAENAGIVTPKLVDWEDETKLQAVGLGADRLGRAIALVEPGELDQGQHDGVRDVFAAPGACLMVRADLFTQLRGFDPAIVLAGEDVDLCWRAHAIGARVVTAPAAVVRHRSSLASGRRTSKLGAYRTLETRHRLRAALVGTGPLRILPVIALAVVTTLVECLVAIGLRRNRRAADSLGALAWNLTHPGGLLGARRRLRPLRKVTDGEARKLLSRSGRLRAAIAAMAAPDAALGEGDGMDRGVGRTTRDLVAAWRTGGLRRNLLVVIGVVAVLLVGSRHVLGRPMPELGSIAHLPDDPLALLRAHASGWRLAGQGGAAPAPAAFALLGLASAATLGATGQVLTLVVLGSVAVGIAGALRLARPLGSWRASVAAALTYAAVPLPYDAFATGDLAGLVCYALAPLLLLRLLRVSGLAPFGATAAAEHGAAAEPLLRGVRRDHHHEDRPERGDRRGGGSTKGSDPTLERSTGGVTVLDREGAKAAGLPAYEPMFPDLDLDLGEPEAPGGAVDKLVDLTAEHALDEIGAFDDLADLDDLVRTRAAARRQRAAQHELTPPPVPRRTTAVHVGALALTLALAGALAPASLPLAIVAALVLLPTVAFAGDGPGMVRAATVGALGTVGALVLLAPWSVDVLRAGQWTAFVGHRSSVSVPSLFDLVRFDDGPVRAGVLGLALPIAALLPLLIGQGWRLAWATRCWLIALMIWALTWAGVRGWLPITGFAPSVLLPLAAAALTLAVALGAAAFEVDLPSYRFGLRQVASVAAGVAVLVACIPVIGAAGDGRWHAPDRTLADVLSWMPDKAAEGPFKVLWVGSPDVVPLSGWYLDKDLVFATSRNGPPSALDEWAGPRRAVDRTLGGTLTDTRLGRTTDLGRLLAPFGVRYLVLPNRAAPDAGPIRPLPADLVLGLTDQVDLRRIDADAAVTVWENAAWAPSRSQLPPEAVDASKGGPDDARSADLSQADAVLAPTKPGSQRFTGTVGGGTVLLAEAPSKGWSLDVAGRPADRRSGFGVANAFDVAGGGSGTLRYHTPLVHWLAIALQPVLWLLLLAFVVRSLLAGAGGTEKAAKPEAPAPPSGGAAPSARSGVVLLPTAGERS